MQPLRREVEAPRRAAGLWAPIAALVGASVVTLVTGIAVTARPARAPVPPPAAIVEVPVAPGVEPAIDPESPCGQRVWRATPDGEAEQFEDCAQQGGRGLGSRGSADGRIVRK